jgi:hypothetical protein
VLENGSNPKPKVLQSLGQNFKIISNLGPESQIILFLSLVKGRIAPKKLLPEYLHISIFNIFAML